MNESTAVRREQLVQTEITLRSILGSLGKQTDQRSAERAAAGPAATPSEADGIAKISNELFTRGSSHRSPTRVLPYEL